MGRRGAFIALIELPKWNGIQNMEGYFEKKKIFSFGDFFLHKRTHLSMLLAQTLESNDM